MVAVWIYGSTKLSQFSSSALVGPGVFVTLIGVGLVLSGAVLVFQMVRSPPTLGGAEDGAETSPFRPPAFLTALIAVAAPIVIMKPLGFPLAASIVFSGVTFAFGSRRLFMDLDRKSTRLNSSH